MNAERSTGPDGLEQMQGLISTNSGKKLKKGNGVANGCGSSFDGALENVIAQVRLDDHTGVSPSGLKDGREEIFSPQPDPEVVSSFSSGPGGAWFKKFRSMFCCFAPTNVGGGEVLYQAPLAPGDELEMTVEVQQPPVVAPIAPPPRDSFGGYVIGPRQQGDAGKKTLVLDLDETLVHSSFKPVDDPDFVIPVDIEGKMVDVYVLKRPWLDHFMEKICPRFETIVFTASLSKYADPLLDLLDESAVVRWRLFREACCPYEGNYVKDLERLGRNLADTIIVDNSPLSYIFQPSNAVPIGPFMGEKDDQELLDLIPILEMLDEADDVREILANKSDDLRLGEESSNSFVPLERAS
ncbi:hypothetical protein BSKO_13318 [Bryopsis sp. KO-2023]|nr:hypothetical protein BSKO_13318 [Bryopsis sp. KO-2023]